MSICVKNVHGHAPSNEPFKYTEIVKIQAVNGIDNLHKTRLILDRGAVKVAIDGADAVVKQLQTTLLAIATRKVSRNEFLEFDRFVNAVLCDLNALSTCREAIANVTVSHKMLE